MREAATVRSAGTGRTRVSTLGVHSGGAHSGGVAYYQGAGGSSVGSGQQAIGPPVRVRTSAGGGMPGSIGSRSMLKKKFGSR